MNARRNGKKAQPYDMFLHFKKSTDLVVQLLRVKRLGNKTFIPSAMHFSFSPLIACAVRAMVGMSIFSAFLITVVASYRPLF